MSFTSVDAAAWAVQHGYQPVAVRTGTKRPYQTVEMGAWTHQRYEGDQVREQFAAYAEDGARNIGLSLGEPSNGLVDIDIDHPKASRLKEHFLPATPMRSGRPGRPNSHYWYHVLDDLPGNRRYQMPDGSVSVELRGTGNQTVIPPSVHPSGEVYRWEALQQAATWPEAPTRVSGRVLAIQVALLALGCVLIEKWPKQGGRHEAYLALAGGLLRYGDDVHPWWERNIRPLLRALAVATGDEDGPAARESEVMRTTINRIREGLPAVGFGKLEEILGEPHVTKIKRMATEVESLSGFTRADPLHRDSVTTATSATAGGLMSAEILSESTDPMDLRKVTWEVVDLHPYLSGEIVMPQPGVLRREDGVGLFYPGRINCLYGQSESAKSWVALEACRQEMDAGERVMYLDFEDEPPGTLARLKALGMGDDDLRHQFFYVHPEEPLEPMQRNRWGDATASTRGRESNEVFLAGVSRVDPSLIIVDGMTVLYGLHGLDTNDATGTDIITNWLKSLVRNGRTTVVVIDHTGKSAPRGSTPLGSQHKVSMVQGTALQVHPIDQPRPGRVGLVELLVGKDRPGQVRQHSTEEKIQVAAEVIIDSSLPGTVQMRIRPRAGDDVVVEHDEGKLEQAKQWSLADALRAHIPEVLEGASAPLTGEEIRDGLEKRFNVRSGYQSWWKVMDALRKDGVVRKVGARKDARYEIAEP